MVNFRVKWMPPPFSASKNTLFRTPMKVAPGNQGKLTDSPEDLRTWRHGSAVSLVTYHCTGINKQPENLLVIFVLYYLFCINLIRRLVETRSCGVYRSSRAVGPRGGSLWNCSTQALIRPRVVRPRSALAVRCVGTNLAPIIWVPVIWSPTAEWSSSHQCQQFFTGRHDV